MKKASIILIVAVLISFSTLAVSLFIAGSASAHPPAAIYLTYKEGTLTVYIDHPSDDPDSHYIESVTVLVNDVEYLSETYTSQTEDGGKGMVVYSYTVAASDGDVISVIAECSVDGSITEILTVGEGGGGKDDPKDDPNKDYPSKDDPTDDGESDQENDNILLLSGAIVGMLIIIIALVAVLRDWKKGTTKNGTTKKDKIKNDDWTTCPKCESSMKMGKLPSHLDKVHPQLSKTAKEKMIERVTK